MLSAANKPARPALPAPIGCSGLWKQNSPCERERLRMNQRDQHGKTAYFVTNAQELAVGPRPSHSANSRIGSMEGIVSQFVDFGLPV